MGRFQAVRAIMIPAALAATLALAACGEKDEPATVPAASVGQSGGSGDHTDSSAQSGGSSTGAGDEQQIATAAEAVIGGNDPQETCEKYGTIVYVKHAYGDVKGCRSAVAAQKPFAVDVGEVDLNGKTATAKAKPRGGPNQGETLKVDLIRQEGIWRVDLVRSHVKVGP
jgi:hypothetical protein